MIPLVQRRAQQMRLITFILALFLVGPAAADEWKEYRPHRLFLHRAFSGRAQDRDHDLSSPERPLVERGLLRHAGHRRVQGHGREVPDDETAENVCRHARSIRDGRRIGEFDIAHRIAATTAASSACRGERQLFLCRGFSHRSGSISSREGVCRGGQAEVEAMRSPIARLHLNPNALAGAPRISKF